MPLFTSPTIRLSRSTVVLRSRRPDDPPTQFRRASLYTTCSACGALFPTRLRRTQTKRGEVLRDCPECGRCSHATPERRKQIRVLARAMGRLA